MEYFLNVLKIVAENYVVLFEFVGILVMLGISAHTPTRMKRLTLTAVILMFVQTAVFLIELRTQDFETLSLWRPMLTAIEYSIHPFIIYTMTMITVRTKLSWQTDLLFLLPAIAVIPLYFSSQWTHLVCWFREDNRWVPGPLRYLPYYVFALYLILFLIRNVVFLHSETRQIRWILYFIVFVPAAGVPLYLFTDYSSNYSLLFTSSIILYYLFIYLHFARFDSLTGLLNRQVYYADMHDGANRIDYAVSIDLNDLKRINDSYGHDAGDTALKTVANVLKKNVGKNGTLYRIGGDEFVIFYHNVDEGAVVHAIETMRNEMAKTPYVCAFGYAKKEGVHTVEDAVRYADREMYDDKAQIKKFKDAERQSRRSGKPQN